MRILRSLTVTKENLVFWLPGMCSSVPAKSNRGDKSTFGKDRQFDCEASERDASQAPSAKRSREIALTPTRAWCFAVRKPTGPFDRFNHGSPVRPELSYVFTKTREIRNQDANLAIAKKHRRRKVLVCWSALRSLVFALIHNIRGSAPTRTRLIPWVAPPSRPPIDCGNALPPESVFHRASFLGR
jgi:hypothetical protein